jgi:hypothetical protein
MLLIAVLLAAPAGAARPHAHAAKTCKPPAYPGNGSFKSLKATKTTCSKAGKVAVAFTKCRTKKGPAGRCVTKVLGFACAEQRTSVATQIDGKVSCRRGSVKVALTYAQSLG